MKTRLAQKRCKACEPGTPPLSKVQIGLLLPQVPGWEEGKGEIFRTYKFQNFYQTMAFVNAVAWVANQENHHPDMEVGYNRCRVRFSTHAAKGLTENDFISAAKLNTLL
ncbi:MAG: 4a-hydroxytetrahydrobiopterin dehydratase [Tepidisphaeraceae bacterium]|jgi:4a-hydroxytetrahydrobiopterin dehydratase